MTPLEEKIEEAIYETKEDFVQAVFESKNMDTEQKFDPEDGVDGIITENGEFEKELLIRIMKIIRQEV